MNFNIKNYEQELLFIPLGGSNEIGINVNLYHYQGKWIMIDCGSGFADEYLPGVEMVVADVDFIAERKKDLLGIVLTHAHEDHLGGIQYLWSKLKCPIYATNFTANFLKLRLEEYNLNDSIPVHVVPSSGVIDLAPFSLELIGLTHSAPEMHAIMIRTNAGNVLHTGDWKFDPSPIVGNVSDQKRLKECGDEGVLALVGDSTNVFNPGTSGSEEDVKTSLTRIIADCPQMVVVTTFSSNIARFDTLIRAGQSAGRKVILAGRSLKRMFDAAQDSGYLQDILPLISDKDVARFKRNELLVIATGCQGETLAATAKMANNSHPSIKLAKNDTVIFSSKIIPGNEKKIFRLFNIFVKSGVEVITERDHFVHVSGHPAIEELKKMYELVRPKVAIPVHGEPVHLHEHTKLAKKCGVLQAIEVKNGDVVLLSQKDSRIIGAVNNGYLAVDGHYLLSANSTVFKMRRRMRDSGLVVINLVLDKRGKVLAKPTILAPGVLDENSDSDIFALLYKEINDNMRNVLQVVRGNVIRDQVQSLIVTSVKKFFKREMNKAPNIIVNLTFVDTQE